MHIIDVNCTGNELSLLDCPYNSLTSVSGICGQYQDASIICQGNILHSCKKKKHHQKHV